MVDFTPYSAKFAGRKIDSGKLSAEIDYQIRKSRLHGENRVVLDTLVLGDRVENSSAPNLPLDLALALLKDADGRIDLDLPVTGDLDHPEFSYGHLIWKAIVNVIEKVVTAPFRAIGNPLTKVGDLLVSQRILTRRHSIIRILRRNTLDQSALLRFTRNDGNGIGIGLSEGLLPRKKA